KDQSSLHKNKNNKKKTVKQLKLRVGLIVFWYLKVSFFPDTFFVCLLKFYSALVICQVIVLITNKTTPTITNSKKMPLATSKK
ncbi:hypothetical protein, partial [Lactobacillus johnsonii]|uniref:hypothetical protein n=1 Tax=Lactobacillus johnsonii TaxID=33959 RepID=UPI001CBB6E3F